MSDHIQLVVFRLDGRRYALPLGVVERIVRAVEVTPLPNAPAVVLGVINMAGRVIPALSLRQRFGLPERELDTADQLLIARTARLMVALVVDEVQGVIERQAAEITGSAEIVPGLEQVNGVVKLEGGLVLTLDLDTCLSLDEERNLTQAMDPGGAQDG